MLLNAHTDKSQSVTPGSSPEHLWSKEGGKESKHKTKAESSSEKGGILGVTHPLQELKACEGICRSHLLILEMSKHREIGNAVPTCL